MRAKQRWAVVALGVAVLASLPYAVAKLPARHSNITAHTLLDRVLDSATVPFSGYAEADGGLGLPSIGAFDDLPELLGGQTNLRVWWRAPTDWRVDSLSVTGEQDAHQDSHGLWLWNYERNRATRVDQATAVAARLPRADDLAPPALARRLLSHAPAGEVTRIASARVAGTSAAGLRLTPQQSTSTIAHVDVWALPATGLPVKVRVVSRSGGVVLSSTMLDLSTATPSAQHTAFEPVAGARVDSDSVTDIVSAVNQFVRITPPRALAGLTRTSSADDSVGVYGRGVTTLIAVPLPARVAYGIADRVSSIARADGAASTLSIGPLTLRLTAPSSDGGRWLLAGTITQATLKLAEPRLPAVADGFR